MSAQPGPLVVLSLDFKDGDLVRMSWDGETKWEASACDQCGATNGEHGRVGGELCPVLMDPVRAALAAEAVAPSAEEPAKGGA